MGIEHLVRPDPILGGDRLWCLLCGEMLTDWERDVEASGDDMSKLLIKHFEGHGIKLTAYKCGDSKCLYHLREAQHGNRVPRRNRWRKL